MTENVQRGAEIRILPIYEEIAAVDVQPLPHSLREVPFRVFSGRK